MKELVKNVEQWAIDKGIKDKATPFTQFYKMEEEVEELGCELYHLQDNPDSCSTRNKVLMELGDVGVTFIVEAMLLGSSAEEVLQIAYNKISKRTGKMINGTFVKSEDL